MTIELLGLGLVGLVISSIAAFFAGNRAATKKAEERARTARMEQEMLEARDAEIAARTRAEVMEARRRIEDAVEKLPPQSTDVERSSADRLRDEWSRD